MTSTPGDPDDADGAPAVGDAGEAALAGTGVSRATGRGVAVVGGQRRRRVGAATRPNGRSVAPGAGQPEDEPPTTTPPGGAAAVGRAGSAEARAAENHAVKGAAADGDTQAGNAAAPVPDRRPGAATVRRSVALALAASTVVCAAAAVGFGLAWGGLHGQQQAANQVRAVSRAFVLDLTNLTPATVDARVNDLLDASTGSFATQAKAFFDGGSPPVRQALVTARAEEQGQIRSLAVQAVNGSTASAFAVVDVAYKSAKITSVQSDVLRLSLGLVDTAHGWKVSDVTVLNGSTGGVLAPPSGSATSGSAASGSAASGSAASGSAPTSSSPSSAG